MKLRFRFFAALLALLGLLTVSVEGAWAAACGAMEVESTVSAADGVTQAKSCTAAAAAFHASGAEVPDGNGSDAPHCPSMPMGATACGVALALPAILSLQLSPVLPKAQLSPHTNSMRELLLAGAFFRPPIA